MCVYIVYIGVQDVCSVHVPVHNSPRCSNQLSLLDCQRLLARPHLTWAIFYVYIQPLDGLRLDIVPLNTVKEISELTVLHHYNFHPIQVGSWDTLIPMETLLRLNTQPFFFTTVINSA